jgi:hypothetical protein
MCNPLIFSCAATHYPLVIDGAMERLAKAKGEVHLSHGAQDVLYKYGSTHKREFDRALRGQNQRKLDQLTEGLHKRLEVALANSKQQDPKGNVYNPPRIDPEALKSALAADPWKP